MKRIIYGLLSLFFIITLTACENLPQVSAEDRLFLDISLDFLGEYELPKQTFQETKFGGLSGLTYDRKNDLFYAIFSMYIKKYFKLDFKRGLIYWYHLKVLLNEIENFL